MSQSTAPALGSLHHRSNFNWLSILHTVMCMLQCFSLKSSHPFLSPLCPKVCSLCLCLLSCHACRIVSTIFLDSICIHSVQFSRSFVSSSLQPHEPQYARPPCPSPILESTQTHVHCVSDAIQPSYPLSSPSPPAHNLSQHQGLFQ